MFSRLRSRFALIICLSIVTATPLVGEGGAVASTQKSPNYILIGFVGGFVRHDNPNHGPVQVAAHMKGNVSKDAYVQVFENRHRKAAYRTILRLLDRDHDGTLSSTEKDQAHIILFGQSWGGAAAVMLARDLNHDGIPVLLTVQVDSVAKLWQNDTVIPANVAEAVNFYQPHGLLHGRKAIRAADPSRTEILGNYRVDYRKAPVHCEDTLSWADRHLTRDHAQSECDPNLWGTVETLVRARVEPQANVAIADPLP